MRAEDAGAAVSVLQLLMEHSRSFEADAEAVGSTTSNAQKPKRGEVNKICEAIKLDVAKVVVMWSNGGQPNPGEAHSILEACRSSFLHLCALLNAAATDGSPTLQAALKAAARSVAAPSHRLLMAVAHNLSRQQEELPLAPLAGKVAAAVGELANLPLDNRAAIGRHVTAAVTSVRDVAREMEEMGGGDLTRGMADMATSSSAGEGEDRGVGARPASTHAHDDEAGCLMFDEDEWRDEELRVMLEGRKLVGSCMALLRSVLSVLVKQEASLGSAESLGHWDDVAGGLAALKSGCDDLGAAMYPPQEQPRVTAALDGLLRAVNTVCEGVREACPGFAEGLADVLRIRDEAAKHASAARDFAAPE